MCIHSADKIPILLHVSCDPNHGGAVIGRSHLKTAPAADSCSACDLRFSWAAFC